MNKPLRSIIVFLVISLAALSTTSCTKEVEDPEAAALLQLKLTAYNLYRDADKTALAEALNTICDMMDNMLSTPPEEIVGSQDVRKDIPPYTLVMARSCDDGGEAVDFYAQLLQAGKTLLLLKAFTDIHTDEETVALRYGETHYDITLQDHISIVGNTADPVRLLKLGSKIMENYEKSEDTTALIDELKSITHFSLFY